MDQSSGEGLEAAPFRGLVNAFDTGVIAAPCWQVVCVERLPGM